MEANHLQAHHGKALNGKYRNKHKESFALSQKLSSNPQNTEEQYTIDRLIILFSSFYKPRISE